MKDTGRTKIEIRYKDIYMCAECSVSAVCLSCSITLCLIPLAQRLPKPGARLSANKPQIFLSPPSKRWGYGHTCIHIQLFTYILGSELRSLCLHRK